MSAGTNQGADYPVTPEDLEWADMVVVMERQHRRKLQRAFGRHLKGKHLVCLDIPDDYDFMDPALIDLLHARMARHLPSLPPVADAADPIPQS
jgi:predicted protein tyrosine phosphatase